MSYDAFIAAKSKTTRFDGIPDAYERRSEEHTSELQSLW